MLVTGIEAQNQFNSTPGSIASTAGTIITMPNGEMSEEASGEFLA